MKYVEIKPDTQEWLLADKVYNSANKWSETEVFEDLEKAIGIPIVKNLECNTYALRLDKIPEGSREQFKQKIIRGKYEAKATSELNRKFHEIIKKHNLENYGVSQFALQTNTWDLMHAICPIKLTKSLRYFLEIKENISEEDFKKITSRDCFIEIKEYDYLRLRADMVKAEEDAQERVTK